MAGDGVRGPCASSRPPTRRTPGAGSTARTSPTRALAGRGHGAAPRQAAHLLRPPGLRGTVRRRHARGSRPTPRGCAGVRAAGLHHALDPPEHGGLERPNRRGLRRPAPRGCAAGRRRGRRPYGLRRPSVGPGLPVPLRRADAAVAGARRGGPPRGAGCRGRGGRRHGADRLRVRPRRGALGPRRAGHRPGGRRGSPGRAGGHAGHRPALRGHGPRARARARRGRRPVGAVAPGADLGRLPWPGAAPTPVGIDRRSRR